MQLIGNLGNIHLQLWLKVVNDIAELFTPLHHIATGLESGNQVFKLIDIPLTKLPGLLTIFLDLFVRIDFIKLIKHLVNFINLFLNPGNPLVVFTRKELAFILASLQHMEIALHGSRLDLADPVKLNTRRVYLVKCEQHKHRNQRRHTKQKCNQCRHFLPYSKVHRGMLPYERRFI